MSVPFPGPTVPVRSRAEVFVGYLDYFRSRIIDKIEGLPESALRDSRLPSGWTPLELLKHLTYVELRWLEWGFEGRPIADPWGDNRGDRWFVAAGETLDQLSGALHTQAERSRAVIEGHDLAEIGKPGPAGRVPIPRRSNASCSISFRSTPATWGTSTSWPSSPTDRSESNQRPGSARADRVDLPGGTRSFPYVVSQIELGCLRMRDRRPGRSDAHR